MAMENTIVSILEALRPGIEGDGGRFELATVDQDGTIKLKQQESCGSCLATIWTHRLRVERAIKKEYPQARIEVDLQAC